MKFANRKRELVYRPKLAAILVCGFVVSVTSGCGGRADGAAATSTSNPCGTRCSVAFSVVDESKLWFSSYASPGGAQIWGRAWNDVWAVSTPSWDTMSGPQSGTCHFDGNDWSCSPAEVHVSAVWGGATGRVFVAGYESSTGEMMRVWDGAWQPWTNANPPFPVGRLDGTSERDLWALDAGPYQRMFVADGFDRGSLAHFDGSSWDLDTLSSPVRGFRVLGERDVWAVGDGGLVAHYDGQWREQRVLSNDFADLWRSPDGELWIVGNGVALRQRDQSWKPTLPDGLSAISLVGIWGRTSDSIWAIGNEGASSSVLHWDGMSWERVFETEAPLYSIWGNERDVWVGGDRRLLRGQ